jgi:GNAT superfamily N-acetyltransferase
VSELVCRRLEAAAADDEILVAELAGVINRAYAMGESGLWRDGTARITAVEVAGAIRDGDMLVATGDGRIAGCAHVRRLDATTADLGLVSADPEQRGRGVGRELVRAAEDLMRARGVTTAQLELLVPKRWEHPEKERLRAWYSRLGYRVVRTAPFEAVATHVASELTTPCEFLVFRKALSLTT